MAPVGSLFCRRGGKGPSAHLPAGPRGQSHPGKVATIVYGSPSLRWDFQQFFHALWDARSAWMHWRRAARAEVRPECIPGEGAQRASPNWAPGGGPWRNGGRGAVRISQLGPRGRPWFAEKWGEGSSAHLPAGGAAVLIPGKGWRWVLCVPPITLLLWGRN